MNALDWALIVAYLVGMVALSAWLGRGQSDVIQMAVLIGGLITCIGFAAGLVWKRATGPGIITGCVAGVGLNIVFWLAVPEMHWMWWNAIGLVVSLVVGVAVSLATRERPVREDLVLSLGGLMEQERPWMKVHGVLAVYFLLILGVAAAVPALFG
ncbi:MAG TPA: hypothetical protein QGF58_18915 [Myxococcota bacterium]|nr:hypothetical protein [Myxococcota bacterium]